MFSLNKYFQSCLIYMRISKQDNVQKNQRARYQDDLKAQIEQKKRQAEEEKKKIEAEEAKYVSILKPFIFV